MRFFLVSAAVFTTSILYLPGVYFLNTFYPTFHLQVDIIVPRPPERAFFYQDGVASACPRFMEQSALPPGMSASPKTLTAATFARTAGLAS